MNITIADLARNVDVAVVTMKDEEREAVERAFGALRYVEGTGNFSGIYVGMLRRTSNEPHLIFTLSQCGQGPNVAQSHVRDLYERFNPRWVIICGICGVVPKEPKVTLGDVVVATRVYGPYLSAETPDRPPRTADSGGPLLPEARALAERLRNRVRGRSDFFATLSPNRRPVVNVSKPSFAAPDFTNWNNDITRALRTHFSSKGRRLTPQIFCYPFLSDSVLRKDPMAIDAFLMRCRDVVAVEMELGGAYEALKNQTETKLTSIRGVSDIVGLVRDENWVVYASDAAALVTRELITGGFISAIEKSESLTAELSEIQMLLPSEEPSPAGPLRPINDDDSVFSDETPEKFSLKPMAVRSSEAAALIKHELQAIGKSSSDTSVVQAREKLERLGLHWVDSFSVNLVLAQADEQGDSLATVIGRYVNRRRPHGADSRKNSESLALNIFIERDKQHDDGSEMYDFVTSHPLISDYLIASNLAWRLSSYGSLRRERDREERRRGLEVVYPFRINQIFKEIVAIQAARDPLYERKIFSSISTMIERRRGPVSVSDTYRHYILGRLADPRLRAPVKALLNAELQGWRARNPNPEQSTDQAEMLLYRTLYVSLGYLGDSQALSIYVATLLINREQDDLNRGFHLEYFGDQMLHGTHPFASRDDLGDFSKTREILIRRLRNPDNPLAALEVQTLASLSQKRIERDSFPDATEREKVVLALRRFIDSAPAVHAAENLLTYLSMVADHLAESDFTPEQFFHSLNRTRLLKRTGWVRRGSSEQETVAAHTMIAVNLAMDFLPIEYSPPSGEYSKATIIQMLLIHDRPEGIVGDIPTPEKEKGDDERERAIMDRYSMMDTYTMGRQDGPQYSGVSGIGKLYREFASGDSYNARVANDIDKVDAIYEGLRLISLPENATAEAAYYDILHTNSSNLQTDLGKFVLQRVLRIDKKYPEILKRAHRSPPSNSP